MGVIYRIKRFFIKPYKQRNGECRLHQNARTINSEIGDYTYVSQDTLITHTKIGKFCSIATNCVIGESDHPYQFISTSPIFYHKGNIFG